MRALWNKPWIVLYKRNVRSQIKYLKLHRELMEEAGFMIVDGDGEYVEIDGVKITYHSLVGLHRAAIRATQVQLLLAVPVFSAIAWVIGQFLIHGSKFF